MRFFFAAADCTGHGVPGAMLSLVCSNKLQLVVKELGYTEPAEVLNQVRQDYCRNVRRPRSGNERWYGHITLSLESEKPRKLVYAGAHNSLYRVTKKNGYSEDQIREQNETHVLLEYKGDKQPIAMFLHEKPFNQIEIQLQEGDVIYVSTDGYADQFGGKTW